MLLLALDTSTTAITVAVHDGVRVLAEATTLDARAHAEQLAPGIETALADAGVPAADLTDVVCGLGPGPFTGLRAGVVTARVLALATGARLRGLCSLDALAHEAWRSGSAHDPELLVATDARRKEVYWARYAVTLEGCLRLTAPAVSKPADLPPDVVALQRAGRGALLYPETFWVSDPPLWPERHTPRPLDVSAAFLADLAVRRIAAGDELDETAVYYLRRPDAATSFSQKSALG